jgi:hypothetical protein
MPQFYSRLAELERAWPVVQLVADLLLTSAQLVTPVTVSQRRAVAQRETLTSFASAHLDVALDRLYGSVVAAMRSKFL